MEGGAAPCWCRSLLVPGDRFSGLVTLLPSVALDRAGYPWNCSLSLWVKLEFGNESERQEGKCDQ